MTTHGLAMNESESTTRAAEYVAPVFRLIRSVDPTLGVSTTAVIIDGADDAKSALQPIYTAETTDTYLRGSTL